MRPEVADSANGVRALPHGGGDSLPTSAADCVDQDRRNDVAGRIVVPRPVIRAERRLERRKETDQVRPFQVPVRHTEIRTCLVFPSQDFRGRDDLGLQPIDSNAGGSVLALDVGNVLVPVKTKVRHGRRSSREPR